MLLINGRLLYLRLIFFPKKNLFFLIIRKETSNLKEAKRSFFYKNTSLFLPRFYQAKPQKTAFGFISQFKWLKYSPSQRPYRDIVFKSRQQKIFSKIKNRIISYLGFYSFLKPEKELTTKKIDDYDDIALSGLSLGDDSLFFLNNSFLSNAIREAEKTRKLSYSDVVSLEEKDSLGVENARLEKEETFHSEGSNEFAFSSILEQERAYSPPPVPIADLLSRDCEEIPPLTTPSVTPPRVLFAMPENQGVNALNSLPTRLSTKNIQAALPINNVTVSSAIPMALPAPINNRTRALAPLNPMANTTMNLLNTTPVVSTLTLPAPVANSRVSAPISGVSTSSSPVNTQTASPLVGKMPVSSTSIFSTAPIAKRANSPASRPVVTSVSSDASGTHPPTAATAASPVTFPYLTPTQESISTSPLTINTPKTSDNAAPLPPSSTTASILTPIVEKDRSTSAPLSVDSHNIHSPQIASLFRTAFTTQADDSSSEFDSHNNTAFFMMAPQRSPEPLWTSATRASSPPLLEKWPTQSKTLTQATYDCYLKQAGIIPLNALDTPLPLDGPSERASYAVTTESLETSPSTNSTLTPISPSRPPLKRKPTPKPSDLQKSLSEAQYDYAMRQAGANGARDLAAASTLSSKAASSQATTTQNLEASSSPTSIPISPSRPPLKRRRTPKLIEFQQSAAQAQHLYIKRQAELTYKSALEQEIENERRQLNLIFKSDTEAQINLLKAHADFLSEVELEIDYSKPQISLPSSDQIKVKKKNQELPSNTDH